MFDASLSDFIIEEIDFNWLEDKEPQAMCTQPGVEGQMEKGEENHVKWWCVQWVLTKIRLLPLR
jgi:hypothetical protein